MANEIVKRLQDRKNKVAAEMRAIVERSTDEDRALSTEEDTEFNAMSAEYDSLAGKIDAQIEGEKRAQDAENELRTLGMGGSPVPVRGDGTPAGGDGGGETPSELRSYLSGKPGNADDGRALELRAPAGFRFEDHTPEVRALVRRAGGVELRAGELSKLTAGAGLNTVPTSFYDRLVQHLIETSGVLRAGPTTLRTDSGEVMQVPKTTAHSSAASIVAEVGTIPANAPTFGQASLGAFKYAFLIQVSSELMADTGIDLDGYLARQGGVALGNGVGNDFVNGGTGGTTPRGILADTTAGVTGGTGVVGAPAADDLISLMFSVIEPYRSNGSFLMKDATLGAVRKMKAQTTGAYVWEPNYQTGVPDTILGRPVYTDPFVPATALSAKSIIFGDFSAYFARFAGGVRVERSTDFAFGTDLVTIRFIMRADGKTVDTSGALKHFAGGAT